MGRLVQSSPVARTDRQHSAGRTRDDVSSIHGSVADGGLTQTRGSPENPGRFRMPETLRVDISYRALRIGWAVRGNDFSAFRQAARYSHALWGGRYNPILNVDDESEARGLIESFRVDLIWPIGESAEV